MGDRPSDDPTSVSASLSIIAVMIEAARQKARVCACGVLLVYSTDVLRCERLIVSLGRGCSAPPCQSETSSIVPKILPVHLACMLRLHD